MKAACWMGTQKVEVRDVPEPKILNQRDAIVRITSTAICGSDLHLYNGFIPTMAAGDDVFVWNPGDDNDTLEGQDGFDQMLFNGANIAENISILANGGRVIFFRDVASVTMDLNDTESITFNALGGADTINVGDLSGTDVVELNLNLAAFGGMKTQSAGENL